MAASPMDQAIKGAPPPNTSLPAVAAAAAQGQHSSLKPRPSISLSSPGLHPSDPTSLLPSSPPQIYLNLLILEASLRSQYLTLRARRRQNTFVLFLLALWIASFTYILFFNPRERDDGSGIAYGGSQYWLLDMIYKLCFITGIVTALLFWATGQWERGVRWPRRWVGIANRGLRGMNAKIVVIKAGFWGELWGWVKFLVPFEGGLWGGERGGGSRYCYVCVGDGIRDTAGEKGRMERISEVEAGVGSSPSPSTASGVHVPTTGRPRHRVVMEDGKEYAEEDIAPGGDYIKLLLLPKPFSPDFREGWEIYRQEYWEKENERRAELRKRVKAKKREIAKAQGGWLWWTGWRGWKRGKISTTQQSHHAHHHSMEHAGSTSLHHLHHHHHHAGHHTRHSRTLSQSSHHSTKDRKRRESLLREPRERSHSRSSSRSTTPTPTPTLDMEDRLRPHDSERRWSSSTAGSTRPDVRRVTKKASGSSVTSSVREAAAQPGTAQSARQMQAGRSSRPGTPQDVGLGLAWQGRRASLLRDADTVDGEGDGGEEGGVRTRQTRSMVRSARAEREREREKERETGEVAEVKQEFVFPGVGGT